MEILTLRKKHSREAKPARLKKKWQMRHYRKNYVKMMQKIHLSVLNHIVRLDTPRLVLLLFIHVRYTNFLSLFIFGTFNRS